MEAMSACGGAGRCKQEKERARCGKANSGDIEGGAGWDVPLDADAWF